jgi:hypothetical protein
VADLGALRGIRARRAALDAEELVLIDRARRDGVTWPAIAEALGLASRQAAEQRRHRLAQGADRDARKSRSELDSGYGDSPTHLREAVTELVRRIGADRRWDARFPRAALVRETLDAGPDAPPGALYDLVAQTLADLTAPEVPSFPAPLRAALRRLAASFAAASPD